MTEEEIREEEKKREAYKLLIGDAVDESDMEFTGNAEDTRFEEILRKNKQFALDPTHKDYHKVA